MVLIYISLLSNEALMLLAIHLPAFMKYLILSFAHFGGYVGFFLLFSFRNLLYISDISVPSCDLLVHLLGGLLTFLDLRIYTPQCI